MKVVLIEETRGKSGGRRVIASSTDEVCHRCHEKHPLNNLGRALAIAVKEPSPIVGYQVSAAPDEIDLAIKYVRSKALL